MRAKTKRFIRRMNYWRARRMNAYYFMMIAGTITGFLTGLAAVVLKNLVHLIKAFIDSSFPEQMTNYFYFVFPIIGLILVYIFIKYVLRKTVGHGIPSVLYAISKNNAYIKPHNMFSSIISSSITVGFGGSVGLEGPTVATGGAIGANVGRLFNLDYQQKIILLGSAAAGAMAAIFKAPIAGVVFALEVIMIDLTTRSIVPILLASVSGSLTSFLFLGQNVLYPFTIESKFLVSQVPYYILLGILTGFFAVYFTKMYIYIDRLFSKIKKKFHRLMIGGILLGALIFIFPALYGEGYESINSCLQGDYKYLFKGNFFFDQSENILLLMFLFLAVVLLKVIATSVTFGAGGIGGIFAPTLFIGANVGLFFATVMNYFHITDISSSNSALIGMGGLIAGVLQAPLTGIFLIADITHGYELFVPLMITATIAYVTVKIFAKNNVYTFQLAKRGEVMTHHADKNILSLMKIEKVMETDFSVINPEQSLGELVKVISESKRNVFPVLYEDSTLAGIVTLDDIRKIIFIPALYDTYKVKDLMYYPSVTVSLKDTMETIAGKIQSSGKFNVAVLDEEGRYLGFVSRANVFSTYRKMLKSFSSD
jgi:CIC family chloride channel protein